MIFNLFSNPAATNYRGFISLHINPSPNCLTPYRQARQAGNVLLYLPREIRDKIFGYYHESQESDAIYKPEDYKPSPLMRTCKHMWRETAVGWFRSHAFAVLLDIGHLRGMLATWLGKQKHFDALQNITRIAAPDMTLFFQGSVLRQCNRLQHIDVFDSEFLPYFPDYLHHKHFDFSALLVCRQLQTLRIHAHASVTCPEEPLRINATEEEISDRYIRETARRALGLMRILRTKFQENHQTVDVSCICVSTQSKEPGFYEPSIFGNTIPLEVYTRYVFVNGKYRPG